jgi:dUTP pyrophosphatase
MQPLRVPIRRLATTDLPLPEYFSEGAAGMDLPAAIADPVVLQPGEFRLIPCGFSLALPPGLEAQIRPRSGLASRHGVTVLNAPGTIDSDYRGEVQVLLVNHGPDAFTVIRGLRIAQLIVAPVATVTWDEVEALPPTVRETGGFGHTGT